MKKRKGTAGHEPAALAVAEAAVLRDLVFRRIVASKIEAPNILANMV